jgi:hypothetical protein
MPKKYKYAVRKFVEFTFRSKMLFHFTYNLEYMALTDTAMDTTKRMTLVNVVRKCLCRIEQNEQNRFVEKVALVSGTYKGTSTSLGIAFGNITSTAEFRRYGLSNNLEKTLKHIVDLFDEEQLMNAVEIIIVHGDQVLIRIKRDDLVDLNGPILVVDVDQVMKMNIDEKTRCCSPVVLLESVFPSP